MLTIRAGLVNLGRRNRMVSLTIEDIQDLFDLKVEGLFPLAQQIYESLHEIGSILILHKFATPAEFVMSRVAGSSAAKAVVALVEYFPVTFRDEYILSALSASSTSERNVYLYKKTQLVVSETNLLFGANNGTAGRHLEGFSFNDDIHQLTAFVDNVVVAMLRMEHVIVLCSGTCCQD